MQQYCNNHDNPSLSQAKGHYLKWVIFQRSLTATNPVKGLDSRVKVAL
jgi:hypothetical protein